MSIASQGDLANACIHPGICCRFGQSSPIHRSPFFPEVYRKGDFIWSGVGLFYALVLWVCAGQIRGVFSSVKPPVLLSSAG
uniref:Ycf66 family protein n=1 Tax=Desertifilum tharense IPPAS B-1220 TaxID=1781255 RepID=A0ACD5GY64_9CYAN